VPSWVRVLAAASVVLVLSGCELLLTPLLMIDPNKARKVATVDIGQAGVSSQAIDLPSGSASIMFAVPGYDCQQPLSGTLEITVQGARTQLERHELRLDQLTWPRPSGAPCQPIGYLRADHEVQDRPLEFTVRRGDNPISFTFDLKQAADTGRPVTIWVVYNDRAPTWRMLGKEE
jgi:hypothetical protein